MGNKTSFDFRREAVAYSAQISRNDSPQLQATLKHLSNESLREAKRLEREEKRK